MSGKSKLSSFIAKGKKKIASKAPNVETAASPVSLAALEKTTAEAAPAVTLDVVQTKVLEQWGGAEDEELVEEAAELSVEARVGAEEEDEDEEIDLPSSQARGKYEWKKKQDELTAEEVARKEAEEAARKKEEEEKKKQEFILIRKKKNELNITESSFPTLGPKSLPSSSEVVAAAGDGKKRRKAKSTSSKARETSEPVTDAAAAEKSAERQLQADDIWTVIGKWSAKSWPSVALDETAVRNRFDLNLLKTITA
eukprot:Gregarina_sp_Pseudo_9__2541@NODE_2813_length_863_cov_31_480583_g2575_i0_p1_GENE_NODE_2813_length_863_cov_31_480583_g2575_i0NODE_2813_length_863_cov_31_480583_g2575_i0_p1_ORF_typecomplete_len254_score68_51_NODE_2813_length_863_cov_31_480583_g2575_i046807